MTLERRMMHQKWLKIGIVLTLLSSLILESGCMQKSDKSSQ
jgi:hypothetical protein